MAAITVTAAQVDAAYPHDARIRSHIASVAITKGQALCMDTDGRVSLCDANTAGKEQFLGIALTPAAIGQAVDVLEEGEVSGFDVSALNCYALVYQNDTAGTLDTAVSVTKTIGVGRVVPVWNGTTATKILRVSNRQLVNW
jgi:hypothetical protein